jgi:plasmid stabilization system protein ParE
VDFQIRVAETAVADFEEILAYSWANFPESTERFGNAILDHLELLKSFPHIGGLVDGLPGVRRLVHAPLLIYYRVYRTPNYVEILHFWHAKRNPPPR